MPWKPRRGGPHRISPSPSPTTTLLSPPFPSSGRRQIPSTPPLSRSPFHRVHLSAAPEDRFLAAWKGSSLPAMLERIQFPLCCCLSSANPSPLCSVNYGFVCLLGWPPAAAASTLLVATDRFSGAEVDRVVDWVSSLAGKVVPACNARVDVDSISLVLLPIKC